MPTWPSTSPWVLSTGATMRYKPSSQLPETENVFSSVDGADITSSGGFLNYFLRPSYQQDALAVRWHTRHHRR